MDYDRVRVKQMARGVLRRARPRPWLVTLVYTLLTTLPGVAVSFVTSVPQTLAGSLSYAGEYHLVGRHERLFVIGECGLDSHTPQCTIDRIDVSGVVFYDCYVHLWKTRFFVACKYTNFCAIARIK